MDKHPYDYKDDVLKRLEKYTPIVHTNSEKEYDFLIDNAVSIEIKNNNKHSLFINLGDEITILFGDFHMHYTLEDDDYEEAMEKVYNIINNKEAILIFYCNGKLFGSGSDFGKDKYTKEDVFSFLKSFFVNDFNPLFKEYGIKVRVCYFDESRNYEIYLDKENFIW